MTTIIISKVWTGPEPPTHCPVHIVLLNPYNLNFSDDGYQGLWKCPKCGRYYAWKPEDSESED